MNRVKHFLIAFYSLTIISAATAATITSKTTGGDWNNTLTWVGNVVPGAGDDVVINGDVSVTASAGCLSLIVNSGKTLTINTGMTLTVNRTSINNWSYQFAVKNDGNIILQAGGGNNLSISLPHSQNWGIFQNNGTFTGNTGKLYISGIADNTHLSNSGTFSAPDTIEFRANGNSISTIGTFPAFDKTVVLNNVRWNASGKTINGTIRLINGAYFNSHPAYGASSTLQINGSYSLSANYYLWPNSSTATDYPAYINFASGTSTLGQLNLTVRKTFTVSAGATVNASNSCFTLSSSFINFYVNGTFNIGSIIVGNGATWILNANYTINKLKIESTGVVTAGNYDLTISSTTTNSCGISGMVDVITGGTFNAGTGTVTLSPGNWYNVNGNISFNNLVVNNSGGGTVVIPTPNTVTVNGNVTVTTGATVNQASNISYGSGATVTNNGTTSGSNNNFPPSLPTTPPANNYLSGPVSGSKSGAASVQSATSATLIGDIEISSGNSKTLTVAPSAELNMGNYAVTADTIYVYGRLNISKPGGLSDAFRRSNGTPVVILGSGSTVTYENASAQNITPRTDYVNLKLKGNGPKTFAAGNYNVAGDFTVEEGDVDITTYTPTFNFNGTGAQNIKGLPFTAVTFSGSGNKTLTDTAKVTGLVTVSGSATLVSNGMLTLKSTASGTASIGPLTGSADISGTINYERYIPAGRLWRFIGWPLNGTTFANSWQNSIHITGAGSGGSLGTTNSNGFDYTTSGEPGIYYYNETSAAASKWTTIPNTSTAIDPTRGYRLFIRGDRAQGISLINGSAYTPQPVTLRGTGTITKGDVPVTLTCSNGCGTSDGWHLLSNPYPSAIDWSNDAWTAARSSNISATVYIYNPAQNRYGSWSPTGGSVNGGSSQIASGQSFYIKTTGATTLTFKEEYKVTNPTAGLFGKNNALVNNLKMKLGDVNKIIDETVVYMYPSATHSFDQQLDATKVDAVNASISTYTASSSSKLVFNAIPELNNGDADTIMLHIPLANANYTYQITFAGIETFVNPATQFILIDAYTGSSSIMTTTSAVYTFNTVLNTAATYANNRFKLVISTISGSLPVKLTSFSGKKSGSTSVLKWTTASELNNDRFDVERSIDGIHYLTIGSVTGAGNSNSVVNYSFIDESPAAGVNYYRLKQVDRDQKENLSNVISINFVELPKTNVTASPIPANEFITVQFNNADAVAAKISITDMVGHTVHTESVMADEAYYTYPIQLDNFKSGIYFMEITQNDGTTESIKFVKN